MRRWLRHRRVVPLGLAAALLALPSEPTAQAPMAGHVMEMVDEIAWPKKAKPELAQGVAFCNLMRDFTASGFFTSQMGVKDLGYAGNTLNKWNGVPDDVLKQYGLSYSDREMKECAKY